MVCKNLPAELWGVIAKELKRDPPPAGTKANWNDHFHQQDLVNLQRVNNHLYQVVSPILYHTPIVQNVGLFILGVERPRPILIRDKEGKNHESVPYHKRTLLDTVTKLYIINASSRIPVQDCFMLAPPSRHSINAPLETCRADRLGTMDLEGWILAANIIDLVKPFNWQQAINFRRLQCLSLFAWDDGRWKKYGRDSYDEEMNQRSFNRSIGRNMHVDAIAKTVSVQDIGSSTPGERVAPTVSIVRILEPVLVRARSTFACGHVSTINDLRYIKGRKVEHQTHFPQQCHFGDRPSRLYSTTKAFDPSVTT